MKRNNFSNDLKRLASTQNFCTKFGDKSSLAFSVRVRTGKRKWVIFSAGLVLGAIIGSLGVAKGEGLSNSGEVFNRTATHQRAVGASKTRDWALFRSAVTLTEGGRDADSVRTLRGLDHTPDVLLQKNVRALLMLNERSLFRYRDALRAILPLLKRGLDSDLTNKARLLQALADVPPQRIEGGSELELKGFRLSATVGRSTLSSLIDTGASFSVLSRSAAARAGLRIRSVGYRVETAINQKISADLAVGDILMKHLRIRNAVFLVFPDAAFKQSGSLSAIIGMPILRQLVLQFGKAGPHVEKAATTLRLVSGTPVVDTTVDRVLMGCEIDTGANRSSIAATHLSVHAFPPDSGGKEMYVMSAAGTALRLRGYVLRASVGIAGREILLPDIFAVSGGAHAPGSVGCRLGQDAALGLAPLTIDFPSMRLILQ